MFDPNTFKRSVKEWIRNNPDGSLNEFVDFCEEQIPPTLYAANQWLIEQTKCWYKHILESRKALTETDDDMEAEDECISA